MNLPADFQFSQSSLQDFADCPRRFFLKYVVGLQYPAPPSAPLRLFEEHMAQGVQFHRLVHQHFVGIPANLLAETIDDERVETWWANFLAYDQLNQLPSERRPEITLSAPLADRRLVAKYDLIAVEPGSRAVIVDWKTSLRRPKRETLARRLQTIVYPYLLVRAGAHLNGGQPIAPESVTMLYWFAEFPDQPEAFTYSAEQFGRDGETLERLAADILSRADEADFPLTEDVHRCGFCTYRSLCKRGDKAASFLEIDDDIEADAGFAGVSLDQVAEVEF